MKAKGERGRRRSRASSSLSSSSSSSSSSTTDLSRVLEKRHREDVKKCSLALGEPRESERRSGLHTRTRAGNSFFHFLAENIILQSNTNSGCSRGSNRLGNSAFEGIHTTTAPSQKRKAVTYTSKINVKIPATCLYQNGGLSLLYTNTKSGCLELRTRVGKTTVAEHLRACGPAVVSLASSHRREHATREADAGGEVGSAIAAVLKTQKSWNSSESRTVARRDVYELLLALDPKKKKKRKKKPREEPSTEKEVEKVIEGILKAVTGEDDDEGDSPSQCCGMVGGNQDDNEASAAAIETHASCWTRDVLLQEYVPCKSMSNTLYRVVWKAPQNKQKAQVPPKVWKISSLLDMKQQPLVNMHCAKTCSLQDVSGRPFVSTAVEITSSFAGHVNTLAKKKAKVAKVVELVLDFVLGEDKRWHMIQVKAFKCNNSSNSKDGDMSSSSAQMQNHRLSKATRARPQSAQPLQTHHKRKNKLGHAASKCCGDYCGALRARENQYTFGFDGHRTEALDLAEGRRQRKAVVIKPFAESNFKVANSALPNGKWSGLNDFILCEDSHEQHLQAKAADVLFKIPYKLIHNDRCNVYEKSDTLVKWMFKSEKCGGGERSPSILGGLENEWESFEETESMLIEDAFQKGCKFFRLSDATSISFVDEKMEHATEMQTHIGGGGGDTHTVMYDLKRHPPFVTQQYIVHRHKNIHDGNGSSLCEGPSVSLSQTSLDESSSSGSRGLVFGGAKGKRKGKLYDMVSVCRDCYRVYLCKEHMKLQVMIRD